MVDSSVYILSPVGVSLYQDTRVSVCVCLVVCDRGPSIALRGHAVTISMCQPRRPQRQVTAPLHKEKQMEQEEENISEGARGGEGGGRRVHG